MKSHPEEVKAKTALNNAIQAGRVVKPSHCSRCGKPFPKRLIQAHHKDYTKPLKPTWVCPRCHAILDAKRRNGK